MFSHRILAIKGHQRRMCPLMVQKEEPTCRLLEQVSFWIQLVYSALLMLLTLSNKYSAKLVFKTNSKQRPLAYDDHYSCFVPFKSFYSKFDMTYEQQPSVNNSHYFGTPRIAAYELAHPPRCKIFFYPKPTYLPRGLWKSGFSGNSLAIVEISEMPLQLGKFKNNEVFY